MRMKPNRPSLFSWSVFSILFALFLSASLVRGENAALTPLDRDCDRFQDQCAQMEKGDVDLLWVGDSITHFWEYASYVYDEFYGNRKTLNFGISGDQTGHVIWRLQHAPLDKIHPKMAVVMIGTNNLGSGSSTPAETVEGIQKVVDILKENYPEMKILLLEIFPRDHKPTGKLRQKVDETNEGIRKVYADGKVENVQLLSLNDLFLTRDGILPVEIMPDFLHPSERGYEIWANAIEPMVIEALGEAQETITPEPATSLWFWNEVYTNHCKQLESKNFDLLMIGDSILHNWVRTDEKSKEYWEKYYGSKGGINLAVGGSLARSTIWLLDHYPLDKIEPKLIYLEVGTNDLTSAETKKEEVAYANRYIVKKLRARWPKVHVIVAKLLPFQFADNDDHEGMEFQEWVDAYNAILPYYFRDIPDVEIVDLSDLYLLPDGTIDDDLMPDRVHPNADGFKLWGDFLNALITEKLSE